MGGLFHLDDLAIFREHPAGEPGQHRPGQIEHAGNFRPAHRQHDKSPVTALRGIDRGVAQPHAQHRLVAARPHPQRLIRIFGANGHQVARRPGATAQGPGDDGLAERRLLVGTRKTVIHFDPATAGAAAEIARRDLAGGPPVQELMVHVHQVLVHEGVVALHQFSEPARPVGGFGRGADAVGWIGRRRHARPYENDSVALEAGIAPHPVRQFALAEIGHVDAAA